MPDYDAIIKAVENDEPLPKNVIDIPDVKESHTSHINCMQELNERIAQLTELVNTGTETLESLKETLKTVEKERDRLADQRTEIESRFKRVGRGEMYFTINDELDVIRGIDDRYLVDNNRYKVNNYFYTKERAEEVTDKIYLLLKLERLHDICCPDCEDGKYYISQNIETGRYCYSYIRNVPIKYPTFTMFPSEEIADKVCDILNAELEEKI